MIYGGARKPGTGNLFSLLPSSSSLLSHRLSGRTAKLTSSHPLISRLSLSHLFFLFLDLADSLSPHHPVPLVSSPSASSSTRSPLLLNKRTPSPEYSDFSDTTVFIPSNVSGRRAYKDGLGFNKSDNVRV